MRAPFPYFGGKYRASTKVWEAFGNPDQYIEPFAGSLAVLLNRPTHHLPAKGELVNDLNGHITNVWRSIKRQPDEVALELEMLGPADELTLSAIGKEARAKREVLTDKLRSDAFFCDPRIAAWWIWGTSCSIGGMSGAQGLPSFSDLGGGVRSLTRRDRIPALLSEFSGRLKHVRIACGDWRRVLSRAVLREGKSIAVFLDPPYAKCSKGLYAEDDSPSSQVAQWCREQTDPRLKVILCGLEGEHDLPGWQTIKYKFSGYAKNPKVDCLYVSPSCQTPSIFGEANT